MGVIQVLPPTLASQIAAGEVVDRPSSALKELLENALDADATRCDVVMLGGGVELLSVRDDGCGMASDDVAACVERHATSKLRRFEDLSSICSFGFRGEALPSIASVSRLTVRSRRAQDAAGTEVSVIGGELSAPREVGMAPGTHVIVEDLFFNVPARRKFLRSSGTEAGHLTEVAEAVALSNPQATITVTRDGRQAREWLRVKTRRERVADVLGEEELAHCYGELGPLTIEAYLGRPERAKAGANGLRLFCNTRPIRDRSLLQSIARAYGSVLERGRYPRGVVYLNLPAALVDVNVHPQKVEVRFADPRAVGDALFEVIGRELQTAFALPSLAASRFGSGARPSAAAALNAGPRLAETEGFVASPRGPNEAGAQAEPHGVASSRSRGPTDTPAAKIAAATFGAPAAPAANPTRQPSAILGNPRGSFERPENASAEQSVLTLSGNSALSAGGATSPVANALVRRVSDGGGDVGWSKLTFLCQVRNLYLLCEGDEGLFVLDQHAAAERVAFDKLKRQLEQTNLASQVLLFPVTVQLEPHQIEVIESQQAEISRLGFELRQRSERTASVHQVPKLLHRADPERLVIDLLNELARQGRHFSEGVDLILATMACHAAVRAGDVVSAAEANALLRALEEVRFSGHCPHGRPIVTFTPWSELERKVGRR